MKNKSVGYRGEAMLDHASVRSIWNQLSTSRGLSEWFAPRVEIDDKTIEIYWDEEGDDRKGNITEQVKDQMIKWVWEDDPQSFVTLEIVKTELTSTVSLLVEDYDRDLDPETLDRLWEAHFEALRHSLGLD